MGALEEGLCGNEMHTAGHRALLTKERVPWSRRQWGSGDQRRIIRCVGRAYVCALVCGGGEVREKENSTGVSRREGEGFLDQEPLPRSQKEPDCVGKVGWKCITAWGDVSRAWVPLSGCVNHFKEEG